MRIAQIWKRNMTDTITGESITVTITYSSFDSEEIDKLEKIMKDRYKEMLIIENNKIDLGGKENGKQ